MHSQTDPRPLCLAVNHYLNIPGSPASEGQAANLQLLSSALVSHVTLWCADVGATPTEGTADVVRQEIIEVVQRFLLSSHENEGKWFCYVILCFFC